MKASHTNMGVTSGEFDAFVEDFVAPLNDFNVRKVLRCGQGRGRTADLPLFSEQNYHALGR